jgi:hypothetical protein
VNETKKALRAERIFILQQKYALQKDVSGHII